MKIIMEPLKKLVGNSEYLTSSNIKGLSVLAQNDVTINKDCQGT